MNIRLKIGKAVRHLRRAHGWSQAELARRSKVSRSYVQKIEGKNPADMSLQVLFKLAKAFKLKCSKLMKDACLN